MTQGQMLMQMLPLLLLIPLMYFLLIRPQKKKDKETNKMRNSVKVGDEIITIGGIVGKVVKTKDDSLVIQVGADKIKFEIMRCAVSRVTAEGKSIKGGAMEEEEAPKKALPKRMKKAEKAVEETSESTASESAEEAAAQE